MSYLKSSPYILLELPDITECINYPIKNVQRIKYTCFDVSHSMIAFGATSGGVYIFNRNPCEFVQLIPNKDGIITRLAIAEDEKHVGFANGKGVVTVTACDQSLNAGYSTVTSKEHQGNEITAMAWTSNNLFMGDDVGKVSVLQLQSFIAKTMFQSSSQTIMCLDSRICQIDVKSCMLLVSTYTRCYICDTSQEQYRQIGQKVRDGEFGACFVNKEDRSNHSTISNPIQDFSEVKQYNIVNDESNFAMGKGLDNILIYCARPSSRLWEATIDGTVQRTHQFKQILARKPLKVVSGEDYETQKVSLENPANQVEGRSVNFFKIFPINSAIFSYKKDALYFLNVQDVDNTIWFDKYNDILDCKVQNDIVYVWLSDGTVKNLKYMKIDKFLLKCFVDQKYVLCAEMCAFFSEYLESSDLSPNLHILTGLKDKIDSELVIKINIILEKIENLKPNEIQIKSGIYVVDNVYNTQTSLLDDKCMEKHEEYKFAGIPPDTMQTLKDLSVTVTDKINTSTKILKDKWIDLEEKMKNLSTEKQEIQLSGPILKYNASEIVPPDGIDIVEHVPVSVDNDIVFNESSQKAIETNDGKSEYDEICKSIYQYFRLSVVSNEANESNLTSMIEGFTCDISEIYKLMLLLKEYFKSIDDLEDSKFAPNQIFLTYLKFSTYKDEFLESITKDEILYKYFVDSCIAVNMKTQRVSNIGCDCGYPLPYMNINQTPAFSDLIDDFIERQWSNHTREQCYDMCKRMPYLWRKILYLRRNEDLLNILRLVLQMLDENLLHTFLPQFTMDTWRRTVQLYATLHADMCLNCLKKFENISVKDTLSWDDLGALMIKSIGAKNAIKVMEENANLIDPGAITVKFYHTCLLVTMYEKYDSTLVSQLTDAIYGSYDYLDAREEICKLLRNSLQGVIKNTALPLAVAAKSDHWGLIPATEENDSNKTTIKYKTFSEVMDNLSQMNGGMKDCMLCGLQLKNDVLIADGGISVFRCGHVFHGACLDLSKIKLCPSCSPITK